MVPTSFKSPWIFFPFNVIGNISIYNEFESPSIWPADNRNTPSFSSYNLSYCRKYTVPSEHDLGQLGLLTIRDTYF